MQLNKIIFLNGPSSSGKTTLAKHLQEKLDDPFLHVGIDTMIAMMPEKLNDWTGKQVDAGFWWRLTKNEGGEQLAEIQLGPYAQQVSDALKEVVSSLLKSGLNVIIDEVCLSQNSCEHWQKTLANYNVLYVGLKAKTETLESRESQRGDRMIGSAKLQNQHVHTHMQYDLELDTDKLSLEDCVQKIQDCIAKK